MIVSASRRTDIPAFHGDWFMKRVQGTYIQVPNPYNPAQISTVSLLPEHVDAFVFWTKNPGPFLPHLEELNQRGFQYYFTYTLNPYETDLEKYLPKLQTRLETFKTLAERLGPDRIQWRYDPVIMNEKYNEDFHLEKFGYLAEQLEGFTWVCITSFLKMYPKIKSQMEPFGL